MSLNPSGSSREPIFNLPTSIFLSVLVLVGIHALRLLLSEETDFQLLIDWAVIPARWSVEYGGVQSDEVLSALQQGSSEQAISPLHALAQYILAQNEGRPWTALSYAFLHGSWAHVIINSIWLAAFGTPVARRCGAGRFLLLCAAAAIGGAILYAFMNPLQILPMIGASAAVSGLMAAASWFIFAPVDWLPEGRPTQPHERPREPLLEMLRNRQVLVFLGFWFAANYIFAFVQPIGITDASIAWEAHIGGFLVGLVLFPLIDPIPARRGGLTP
ncbi:rhomboid family intramembrane serine protease [Microvirga terricola]|uniref:Rhomboid family intramembrane serine protease n=1 Tax=Microvirga terricola TaxID=2719797 RepID=A0ABX0VFC8_9HYPH|nr:rhomboid family intramembrane serine protease [Microvirga terricola]NIX76602.1 rhomboid family intramembrane serine protease [Microvirga terricola]